MGFLFLAFTLVPLVELYLLVYLSDIMGLGTTIALVLLTGSLGASLARAEGLRVLRGFQSAVNAGRVPEDGVISAVLVLVGGVLLVTPGVLTDLVGLALLLPWSRRWLAGQVAAYVERGIQQGHVRVVRAPGIDPFQYPPADPGAGGVASPQASGTPRPSAGGGWRRQGGVIEVESRVVNSEPKAHNP